MKLVMKSKNVHRISEFCSEMLVRRAKYMIMITNTINSFPQINVMALQITEKEAYLKM